VSAYKEGKFLKDPGNRGKGQANPMTDPAAMEGMMGMMKGNMAMMIPQTLIMGWINAFFAGFVVRTSPQLLSTHYAFLFWRFVLLRRRICFWQESSFTICGFERFGDGQEGGRNAC